MGAIRKRKRLVTDVRLPGADDTCEDCGEQFNPQEDLVTYNTVTGRAPHLGCSKKEEERDGKAST